MRIKNEEKPRNSEEYIDRMMKKKKKVVKISVIIVLLIVILLGMTTALSISTMTSNKIIKGTSIRGVDVSGLTKDEAYALLEKKLEERQNLKIKLKYQDYEKEISTEQLEIKADIEPAVDEAIKRGRDGNIFSNNINIIKSKFNKKDIGLDINYKEEELDKFLTEINLELPGGVKEYTYSIEDGELIITPGTDGIAIEKEVMKASLVSEITDFSQDLEGIKDIQEEEKVLQESITPEEAENTEEIAQTEKVEIKHYKLIERDIKVKQEKAKQINIEEIYNEIHSEPEDAYIVEEPFQVVVDKPGIDFAISIDEAKSMIAETKEEYVIPLKITQASKTVASLGSRAFPNLLATFTTRYDAGNVPRTTNLSIACNKINGYVVQPGEIFSYNKVLGKRTSEAGYKEAAVFTSTGVENGLGGGICQISTTLYNAVLLANLGIEERHNHNFVTSYIEAGKDATVSYGIQDFKFKNTRKYPVKIEAYIKSGVATVSIYGLKEDPEYKISVVATVTSTIPAPEERIEDPELAEGTEIVQTKGSTGYRSVTHKYTYAPSGELVSKTQLSSDTYRTITRVVKVGTKKAEQQPPVVVPEPTPEPTSTPEPTIEPTPVVTPTQNPEPTPTV